MSNHHARPLCSPARSAVVDTDTRSAQLARVSTVRDGQADRRKKEIHARPISPFLEIRVGEDDTGWALNVVGVIKKWWEA
jgi:hypothetical protein